MPKTKIFLIPILQDFTVSTIGILTVTGVTAAITYDAAIKSREDEIDMYGDLSYSEVVVLKKKIKEICFIYKENTLSRYCSKRLRLIKRLFPTKKTKSQFLSFVISRSLLIPIFEKAAASSSVSADFSQIGTAG